MSKQKKKALKAKKQKPLLPVIICNLFAACTIVFFRPMTYMLENLKDFLIPFENVWWIQMLLAIGIAAALTGLMMLLPPKAGRIGASLSLGFGLAFLAQSLLFNSDKPLEMNTSWPMEVLNIFVWFGIAAIAVAMVIYFSGEYAKRTELAIAVIAGVLILYQAVGFVVLAVSTDTSVQKENHYLSSEGEFTLSNENNTIVFVLGNTDEFYFNRMLKKFPDMKETLAGWVHYTNTTSVYSRTYPSITYLLTGKKCCFDKEPVQYVEEAFSESVFLKQMNDQGTDVRVFTMEPGMVSKNTGNYIANSLDYPFSRADNLAFGNLENNMLTVSMYDGMPFHLKRLFRFDMETVNYTSVKEGRYSAPFSDYNDPVFLTALKSGGIILSDRYSKAFRFYHIHGISTGYSWDENMVESDDSAPENALRGSFMIIETYISMMKEAGIYDKATIIVIGDHGFSGGNMENLDVPAAACPMILVKYPNQDDHEPLKTNEAPVSQEDLFATAEAALDVKISGSGSGRKLEDIGEAENRSRYYYYTAFYTEEDGEVALREYEINGQAGKLKNWRSTGAWWDIRYSMNRVSENRFQEE